MIACHAQCCTNYQDPLTHGSGVVWVAVIGGSTRRMVSPLWWLWLRGRASVLLSESYCFSSPGLHDRVSLAKIPKPKLFLMCWSASRMAVTAINVWMHEWITVSHFGQKHLLNVNVNVYHQWLQVREIERLVKEKWWTIPSTCWSQVPWEIVSDDLATMVDIASLLRNILIYTFHISLEATYHSGKDFCIHFLLVSRGCGQREKGRSVWPKCVISSAWYFNLGLFDEFCTLTVPGTDSHRSETLPWYCQSHFSFFGFLWEGEYLTRKLY